MHVYMCVNVCGYAGVKGWVGGGKGGEWGVGKGSGVCAGAKVVGGG